MNKLVCLLIVSSALSGCAPPRSVASDQRYLRPTGPEVFNLLSSTPLNSPPADAGNGVSLAVRAASTGGAKGEYESSAEYQRRISAIVPESSAFTIALSKSGTSYDADTGYLDVNVFLSDAADQGYKGNNYSYQKTYPAILAGGIVKINGEHLGQNAFGASATVTEVSAKKVFLVLGDLSAPKPIIGSVKGRFTLSPAVMKAAANDLALRIEGRSASPYFFESGDFKQATIHTKQDTSSRLYFFRIDPTKVALVNAKTGVIYGNLQLIATKY